MDKKDKSFSDSNYYKQTSKYRRLSALAVAYLERARIAGIPPKHMRVDPDQCRELLSPYESKEDKEKMIDLIFNRNQELLNYPFMTIEGGNIEARKRMGFCLMFRMILCDTFSKHVQCSHLINSFQVAFTPGSSYNRMEWVEEIKNVDSLFISEVSKTLFDARMTVGRYFDEVLDFRCEHDKPTIISFSEAISAENELKDGGGYLMELASDKRENRLKIKVKKYG